MFQSTHMEYVVAAATLYGQIYGIKGKRDSTREILKNIRVPSFTPKSSVKIHLTDKEMQEDKEKQSGDAGKCFVQLYYSLLVIIKRVIYCLCVFAPEKAKLEELKAKLASPSLKVSAKQMYPIDFEKVRQWHIWCTHCRQSGGSALAGSYTPICRCF